MFKYCQCSSFSDLALRNASSTSLNASFNDLKLAPRSLSAVKPEMKSEYFTDSRNLVIFRLVVVVNLYNSKTEISDRIAKIIP